jgi:pSer/pThr/pTyr-binding forkhead associated (FHA) protein
VYRDADGAKVLDDRSLNGVFRNGDRVELSELEDGDTVAVGRFTLHFISLSGSGGGAPVNGPAEGALA